MCALSAEWQPVVDALAMEVVLAWQPLELLAVLILAEANGADGILLGDLALHVIRLGGDGCTTPERT